MECLKRFPFHPSNETYSERTHKSIHIQNVKLRSRFLETSALGAWWLASIFDDGPRAFASSVHAIPEPFRDVMLYRLRNAFTLITCRIRSRSVIVSTLLRTSVVLIMVTQLRRECTNSISSWNLRLFDGTSRAGNNFSEFLALLTQLYRRKLHETEYQHVYS